MVDVDELKQKELENIKNQDNTSTDEVYDLESLILDGAKAKIPIIVDYPLPDGSTQELGLKLKPLTDVEVNNAMRALKNNPNTSFRIEYLKRGLYTKDDEPFPQHLLKEMHTGVVGELCIKLMDISGIKTNKEAQQEIMDKLLGF